MQIELKDYILVIMLIPKNGTGDGKAPWLFPQNPRTPTSVWARPEEFGVCGGN